MLELKNIRFDVQEGHEEIGIIQDVSFTIPDNKFVVVTGPNGGGKSTLARLIAGIEKPTAGTILLDGEDITDKSITDRARMGISYAMQQPVRFKGIQVLDLLRLAAGKRVSVADACQYLSRVGLCAKDYIKREVNASLSGGELKRIEIATVLARGTLWSFQNLIQVFEQMRDSIKDSSILIISHQERILEIADEIIVVADGKIERQGSRDEILPSLIGTTSAVGACVPLGGKPAQVPQIPVDENGNPIPKNTLQGGEA